MKRLIIFDLEDTLADGKRPLTDETATLLTKLLVATKIAVASEGDLPQFIRRFVYRLPRHTNLANLYIITTSGAALYEFDGEGWEKIYEEQLLEDGSAVKPEVDKAYGIRHLCKRLGISESDTLYIGDGLADGGNDDVIYKTNAATCMVDNPSDTIRTIKTILTAA